MDPTALSLRESAARRWRCIRPLDQLHSKRAAQDSIRVRIHPRSALHQHKRRLAALEVKLDEARRQTANPSLCFGSRELIGSSHRLQANGFASRNGWRGGTWQLLHITAKMPTHALALAIGRPKFRSVTDGGL
jgi:hypothetical protein